MTTPFWMRLLLAGVILTACAALPTPRVDAQGADLSEKVYQRCLKSSVWILAVHDDGKQKAVTQGTGSLIDLNRRVVLTNYHVVGKTESVICMFPHFDKNKLVAERKYYVEQLKNKNFIEGKVAVVDVKHDLALVVLDTVPPGALPIPLAKESPKPGQRVHSVGNPGDSGALWVYTQGTVRQVYNKQWRAMARREILELDSKVVETQSPTNPGDSGGPLLNDAGELVAVTQGGTAYAQLLSLFIDVSEVRGLLAAHGIKLSPVASLPTPVATPSTSDKPTPDDDLAKQEQAAAVKLKLAILVEESGNLTSPRHATAIRRSSRTSPRPSRPTRPGAGWSDCSAERATATGDGLGIAAAPPLLLGCRR
jgi:hypothetical protein